MKSQGLLPAFWTPLCGSLFFHPCSVFFFWDMENALRSVTWPWSFVESEDIPDLISFRKDFAVICFIFNEQKPSTPSSCYIFLLLRQTASEGVLESKWEKKEFNRMEDSG